MEYNFKELANNKSSKDSTHDERVSAYLGSKPKKETFEEKKARIHAFRCGW